MLIYIILKINFKTNLGIFIFLLFEHICLMINLNQIRKLLYFLNLWFLFNINQVYSIIFSKIFNLHLYKINKDTFKFLLFKLYHLIINFDSMKNSQYILILRSIKYSRNNSQIHIIYLSFIYYSLNYNLALIVFLIVQIWNHIPFLDRFLYFFLFIHYCYHHDILLSSSYHLHLKWTKSEIFIMIIKINQIYIDYLFSESFINSNFQLTYNNILECSHIFISNQLY
jgi:hypothetical protein